MDLQTFIKKPIVIANLLILVFFIIFPYFTFNMGGFGGGFGGVSKTGLGLFFTIFDSFSFINFLLILVPVASGYILFQTWKGENSLVMVCKIVILAILGYLFLHIAFFAEKSSIKFVGFGLWLSLIVAIAQLFETKINEMICPKKSDETPVE